MVECDDLHDGFDERAPPIRWQTPNGIFEHVDPYGHLLDTSTNDDTQVFLLVRTSPMLALVDMHEHSLARLEVAKTHCERRMLELTTARAALLKQGDLVKRAEKAHGSDRGEVVDTHPLDRLLWEYNAALSHAEEYLNYIFSIKDALDQLETIGQF